MRLHVCNVMCPKDSQQEPASVSSCLAYVSGRLSSSRHGIYLLYYILLYLKLALY